MPAFLVARTTEGETEYWTGAMNDHGGPRRTLWKSDAYHFTTRRAAYEAAATHAALRDSDSWKVVKR